MADDKFFWFLTCSYNITSVWLVGTVGYVFLCSCCVTQIGYFLQPMDQHQRLSRCFDKLQADVTRSLDSKNRDKFTQNVTIFQIIQSYMKEYSMRMVGVCILSVWRIPCFAGHHRILT